MFFFFSSGVFSSAPEAQFLAGWARPKRLEVDTGGGGHVTSSWTSPLRALPSKTWLNILAEAATMSPWRDRARSWRGWQLHWPVSAAVAATHVLDDLRCFCTCLWTLVRCLTLAELALACLLMLAGSDCSCHEFARRLLSVIVLSRAR